MGILHREDAGGQQICTHLSLRETDGANPQSGRLITQETSSPPSSARDASAIGGAREGMPRQSRHLRLSVNNLNVTDGQVCPMIILPLRPFLVVTGPAPGLRVVRCRAM